jgi:hypothetical protein
MVVCLTSAEVRPLIETALAIFVALDLVIIAHGGLGRIVPSARALVYQPVSLLLIMAVICLAAAFHECGHVSACHHGSAKPGTTGIELTDERDILLTTTRPPICSTSTLGRCPY